MAITLFKTNNSWSYVCISSSLWFFLFSNSELLLNTVRTVTAFQRSKHGLLIYQDYKDFIKSMDVFFCLLTSKSITDDSRKATFKIKSQYNVFFHYNTTFGMYYFLNKVKLTFTSCF